MTTQEMIAALESSMHDHHTEYDGLNSCDGIMWDMTINNYVDHPVLPCTCGAKQANERIRSVIEELKKV